jgi:hypothetical protein
MNRGERPVALRTSGDFRPYRLEARCRIMASCQVFSVAPLAVGEQPGHKDDPQRRSTEAKH